MCASTSSLRRVSRQDVDGRELGKPSALAFGKPKGELRDAVLRTAMPGHDASMVSKPAPAPRRLQILPRDRRRRPVGQRAGRAGRVVAGRMQTSRLALATRSARSSVADADIIVVVVTLRATGVCRTGTCLVRGDPLTGI